MSKRFLVQQEAEWLFEHGFTIRSSWISPYEGAEYRLAYMGSAKTLAFRKSERACYNAARKIVAAEQHAHRTPGNAPVA